MFNRKYFVTIAAVLVSVWLTASVQAADAYAPKPITETERCPVCGMYPAKYPKWHSQIVFTDGEHSSFDSPRELFRFMHGMAKYDKHHAMKDIGKLYVPDFEKGEWLDARIAYFVRGSGAKGPMGDDLPAFASKDAAAGYAQKSGGEVLTFEQVTPAVVGGTHGH